MCTHLGDTDWYPPFPWVRLVATVVIAVVVGAACWWAACAAGVVR